MDCSTPRKWSFPSSLDYGSATSTPILVTNKSWCPAETTPKATLIHGCIRSPCAISTLTPHRIWEFPSFSLEISYSTKTLSFEHWFRYSSKGPQSRSLRFVGIFLFVRSAQNKQKIWIPIKFGLSTPDFQSSRIVYYHHRAEGALDNFTTRNSWLHFYFPIWWMFWHCEGRGDGCQTWPMGNKDELLASEFRMVRKQG